MSSSGAETGAKKIILRSSDGEVFEVEESVAVESQTIKHMIEDDCADTVIPLPNVTGKILSKVIEYCKRHVDSAAAATAAKVDDKLASTAATEDDLKAFDADYLASICSAGDSAAYHRSSVFGDDMVIVAAFRTAQCKAKRGGFKDTYPDDLLAPVLKLSRNRKRRKMAGGHGDGITYNGVTLHKPKRWHTVTGKGLCAVMWFWVFYRAKKDGPVVLGWRHPWDGHDDHH